MNNLIKITLLVFFQFINISYLSAQIKLSKNNCYLNSSDSIISNIKLHKVFNAEVHHSYLKPENFLIETKNNYRKGIISWSSSDKKFKMIKRIIHFDEYNYPLDSYSDIDLDNIDYSKIQSLVDLKFNSIIKKKFRKFDKILLSNICKKKNMLVIIGENHKKMIFYKIIFVTVDGGIDAYVELIISYPKDYEKEYNGIATLFLNNFKGN